MWLKKIIGYLGLAVRSNTGISSLSLSVVLINILTIITVSVVCACMMIEVITTHTISTSLDGYAAIIGAVSALNISGGIPKAINNYGENKYNSTNQDEPID